MSEDTKIDWNIPIGKFTWSSPTSAFVQISVAFLLFALLAKYIDQTLSKVLIYTWILVTIAGLIKFKWVFFTGKTAKEIISPSLGSKDNPLIDAQDAVIVPPPALTEGTQKKRKQRKGKS